LIARMQFVMPPDMKRTLNLPIPKEVKQAYYKLFYTLVAWREEELFMSPDKPYRVTMTEEAREAFLDNLSLLEDRRISPDTPDVMKSVISKMEGITGRIALVLHIADYAARCSDGKLPMKIPPVERATMGNAVRITRWLLEQTERVLSFIAPMSMMGGGLDVDAEISSVENATLTVARQNAVLEAMQIKGRITKSDLHNLRVFRDTDNPAEVIEATLNDLYKRGVIKSEFVQNPKGGPAREYFWLAEFDDSETIENTEDY